MAFISLKFGKELEITVFFSRSCHKNILLLPLADILAFATYFQSFNVFFYQN